MVKEWTVRIRIPSLGIDETYRVNGSFPWTAMNRAVDVALREAAENLGLMSSWNRQYADTYAFRLKQHQHHIEGMSVKLVEVPATRAKRLKAEKKNEKKKLVATPREATPLLQGF